MNFNRDHIERMYARNLADWEEAINYYLNTGDLLNDRGKSGVMGDRTESKSMKEDEL